MKSQIEKIDNAIITASITLLASYVVFYSSEIISNFLFNIVTISSIVLLVICLLLTLYGKYRESLRKSIFNVQKEKWAEDLKTNLDKLEEDFFAPQIMKAFKASLDKEENRKMIATDPEKFKSTFKNEWEAWTKDFELPRKIFAENQALRVQKMLDDSFSGPLKEKNSIIKYQLERFADKRYTIFVLGLITFVASIGIKLFSK